MWCHAGVQKTKQPNLATQPWWTFFCCLLYTWSQVCGKNPLTEMFLSVKLRWLRKCNENQTLHWRVPSRKLFDISALKCPSVSFQEFFFSSKSLLRWTKTFCAREHTFVYIQHPNTRETWFFHILEFYFDLSFFRWPSVRANAEQSCLVSPPWHRFQ